MVWVRIGDRRYGRGGGYGYGPGYGGYRGGGGGGGGCLRDLLFLNAGCCLAEALGCGPQLVLLAPAALGLLLHPPAAPAAPAAAGARGARAVALVRLYQERISVRRRHGCCRMEPTCSNYAVEALSEHGTARGLRLTAARLLRCRPGGPRGADPVPAA